MKSYRRLNKNNKHWKQEARICQNERVRTGGLSREMDAAGITV